MRWTHWTNTLEPAGPPPPPPAPPRPKLGDERTRRVFLLWPTYLPLLRPEGPEQPRWLRFANVRERFVRDVANRADVWEARCWAPDIVVDPGNAFSPCVDFPVDPPGV